MATTPEQNSAVSVNHFLTSLRSQSLPQDAQGNTSFNFSNIAKEKWPDKSEQPG